MSIRRLYGRQWNAVRERLVIEGEDSAVTTRQPRGWVLCWWERGWVRPIRVTGCKVPR